MRDGWIKVAAASPQIKVADCAYNTDSIKKAMRKAEEEKVKLLVLERADMSGLFIPARGTAL